MRALVCAIALLLAGCTGTTYELDQRYAPLERIREAEVPGLADTAIATVFTEVLTKDLAAFLLACPPGSVELDAVLQHERVHAVREFSDPTFFPRYAASKSFRWQEEKAGWAVELALLKKAGRQINVEVCAEILSGPVYLHMISKDEARAWVQEQLR